MDLTRRIVVQVVTYAGSGSAFLIILHINPFDGRGITRTECQLIITSTNLKQKKAIIPPTYHCRYPLLYPAGKQRLQ